MTTFNNLDIAMLYFLNIRIIFELIGHQHRVSKDSLYLLWYVIHQDIQVEFH